MRFPVRGLVTREVRSAMPVVFAVLALTYVALIVAVFELAFRRGSTFSLGAEGAVALWGLPSIVIALLLGVLCGAEEEENETADFVKRLPVARSRILLEKLLGSAAAYLLWGSLNGLLAVVFLWAFSGGEGMREVAKIPRVLVESGGEYFAYVRVSALLYCFGLAAGAWIGRVLLSALLAAIGATVYPVLTVILIPVSIGSFRWPEVWDWGASVLWVGCILAFVATAIRYRRREGT